MIRSIEMLKPVAVIGLFATCTLAFMSVDLQRHLVVNKAGTFSGDLIRAALYTSELLPLSANQRKINEILPPFQATSPFVTEIARQWPRLSPILCKKLSYYFSASTALRDRFGEQFNKKQWTTYMKTLKIPFRGRVVDSIVALHQKWLDDPESYEGLGQAIKVYLGKQDKSAVCVAALLVTGYLRPESSPDEVKKKVDDFKSSDVYVTYIEPNNLAIYPVIDLFLEELLKVTPPAEIPVEFEVPCKRDMLLEDFEKALFQPNRR